MLDNPNLHPTTPVVNRYHCKITRTDLATNLRNTRTAQGLTQATAARHTGTHRDHWARWESGTRRPWPEKLPRIAAALGVPVGALFDETVVAEVRLSPESKQRIQAEGMPAALEIAQRLALRIASELLRASQPPPAPRRRTRAQVLAQQRKQLDQLHARTKRPRQVEAGGEGPTAENSP